MRTPWGIADSAERIADGITFYTTPSHGGVGLSAARQRDMPDALRVEGGWYEEDCDYALVVVAFPDEFPAGASDRAAESVANWQPERFEKHFGATLRPEDSHMLRQRARA